MWQRAFVVEYTSKVTAVDPPAAGGRAALPRPATTHGLPLATSLGEPHCRFVQQPPCIPSHCARKRRLTSSETLPSKTKRSPDYPAEQMIDDDASPSARAGCPTGRQGGPGLSSIFV